MFLTVDERLNHNRKKIRIKKIKIRIMENFNQTL